VLAPSAAGVLACLCVDGVQWRSFLPSEAARLCALFGKADELVTVNGNGFDMLVVMKHHGLKATVAKKLKHRDIFELIAIREDRGAALMIWRN